MELQLNVEDILPLMGFGRISDLPILWSPLSRSMFCSTWCYLINPAVHAVQLINGSLPAPSSACGSDPAAVFALVCRILSSGGRIYPHVARVVAVDSANAGRSVQTFAVEARQQKSSQVRSNSHERINDFRDWKTNNCNNIIIRNQRPTSSSIIQTVCWFQCLYIHFKIRLLFAVTTSYRSHFFRRRDYSGCRI